MTIMFIGNEIPNNLNLEILSQYVFMLIKSTDSKILIE